MISQLHMAKTGLFVYQNKMQMIANNIANAQTVGFKGMRMELETMFPMSFEKLLTDFDESGAVSKKRKKVMEYGQGVRIADISRNFNQGTIEVTNQPLDVAIKGQGLLQFRIPDGSTAYARAGNLRQDRDGTICDVNGHPLEPSIQLPQGTSDVLINEEGRIFAQVGDEPSPREIGQIILANFQNPSGLKEMGQNLYVETDASGSPRLENPGRNGVGTIQQKALEFSNVNVIEQMTSMLMAQRIVELVAKAITASDAILKKGGGL